MGLDIIKQLGLDKAPQAKFYAEALLQIGEPAIFRNPCAVEASPGAPATAATTAIAAASPTT